MITKKEFEDYKNSDFSILPMAREIVSPADNPLSLFSKIADKKNNFLFESVEGEISGLNTQLLVLDAWILSRHMEM